MKKINLRGLSEVLKEKELKNVLGGSGGGSGTCGYRGAFWEQVHEYEGPFHLAVLRYALFYESECNVSYEYVMYRQSIAEPGTFWWCCDHCDTSTYCG